MGHETEAVAALYAFLDGWNREDAEAVLASFSPDAVVTGLGNCKGCPCVGRESIIANVLDRILRIPGQTTRVDVSGVKAQGERVDASWSLAIHRQPSAGPNPGLFRARGWLTITTKAGLITGFRFSYDLADPQTAVYRSLSRDTVFALQLPGQIENSNVRAACHPMGPQCAVVLTVGRPGTEHAPLSAHIFREGVPGTAFPLNDLIEGRSGSIVAVSRDELIAGGYGIAVLRGEETLARGLFPTPHAAQIDT